MSYTEDIRTQSLANNHTLVEFQFSLRDDVHVQCEGANEPTTCSTEVNLLPLHVLGLVTQSKASLISFHSPSGQWNEHMWGAKPADRAKHRHLINSDGTHSTALAANTHLSNYPTLRAHLSTLLGSPLNPNGVDTSQHPLKVSKSPTSNGTEGALHPDSDSVYVQFFPLLGANADKWSLWSKHLLPCGGKSGVAALLDSHALHSSLYYSLSLNIHAASNNNTSTTTTPVADSADSRSELSGNGSLSAVDEARDGVYSVHMTVSVSMVVPTSIEETAQRIPHKNQHTTNNVLSRIQQATSNTHSIYNKKCSATTTKPTITYSTDAITSITIPFNSGDNSNKSTVDGFWQAVLNNNTYNADNYSIIGGANATAMSVDRNQELTMLRKLFDSRSMEFTVVTTIQSPATHPSYTPTHNTSCAHHYTEPLAEAYTIDLSTYRYILLTPTNNDYTSSNTNTEGLVRDLPGYYQGYGDCTSQFAYMKSTRHCTPSYSFPLPSIPPLHTLLLTYTANKRLLSREHQPIDASRGAVIQPAVLYSCAVSGSGSADRCSIQSTASFIVLSPIPDGSMPFNVITLVSTLLAFFLGSFINALLKNGKKKEVVETKEKNIPVPVVVESTAE